MKRKPLTARDLLRQSINETADLRRSVEALTTRLDNMPRPTLIASELQSIRGIVEAIYAAQLVKNGKARK